MAKRKKNNADRIPYTQILRTIGLRIVLPCAVLAGLGFGYNALRKNVETRLAIPSGPPGVILMNQPNWMSDALAEQIAKSVRPRDARSALDQRLLMDIASTLEQNPWVRNIRQVRRAYHQSAGGMIEIDCEYRAPVALIPYKKELILIDGEGFKLPERFPLSDQPRVMFGEDGRTNLRIIDGVGAIPPYLDGQKWAGEDLQAGLDMVKLLHGRMFAEDIVKVNVANYRGRRNPRDPQLVLVTRHGSEIRWGEPVKAAFHAEISPAEKLVRLEKLVEQHGRVDAGHSWLDIRLDKITYPAAEAPIVRASQNMR